MAEVIVCYNDNKICISINGNGNLSLSSLKTHFPSADGLTYEDDEGKIQILTVASEEVILNPEVKKYFVHHSSEVVIPQTASHMKKASALENIEENANKENELNGTDEKFSEENRPNGARVFVERPVKVQSVIKTLRVGWLNKAGVGAKYRKMGKPRGGVKKLKLDAAVCYLAYQIRRMAIEAFEESSSCNNGENRAIEDEYVVNLGDFGGKVISEFRRKDGTFCDIWDYCKDRGKRLYQLNLFMLTWPIDVEERIMQEKDCSSRTISTRRVKAQPRTTNDVRVLYEYARRSIYSNELSYTELEKSELHNRLFEDQYGVCPAIEQFEPSDYGFSICRVVKSGQVLLQISIDDSGAKTTHFPASMAHCCKASLKEHAILHDVDQLQGYCNRKFGIGFVPSCNYACQPIFSWYKDGELFKKHEYLYWLDDVKDDQPHFWSCTVTCANTARQLKSKEICIDGS